MDNPEKIAAKGTQDEETKNQEKTNTICGHHYGQAHTHNVDKI